MPAFINRDGYIIVPRVTVVAVIALIIRWLPRVTHFTRRFHTLPGINAHQILGIHRGQVNGLYIVSRRM